MWHSARASTGSDRSRLQPPLLVSVARSAHSRLSASKPASQVAKNGCRLPVMVMSWVRLSRRLTGCPVSVAPSAAMAASQCGLGLQVEVLLAADLELAAEPVGGRLQRGGGVAAADRPLVALVAAGLD